MLLSLQAVGAQVLDVRDAVEYARAHLKGSLNIGLGGSYATWAGTILDREKPIVIIAEPGRQEEAAMRLGRIGFDSVVGYLRDGISALESRTDLMTGTTRVTPAEAAAALASSTPPLVLDIRAPTRVAELAHRRQRQYPAESSRRADRGSARQHGPCSSTARAGIARRSPPACCSDTVAST